VSGIGLLNEKPLHAALKAWYAQPGDQFEARIDGFVVDIVRDDLLIEIQTSNFTAIKPKLLKLATTHPLRLVYPIAQERWLVKRDRDGSTVTRKSPKRGAVEDVFWELVRFPLLLANPNLTLQVLLIREEEVRRRTEKRGRWRREWVTEERRLLEVVERRLFETPADLGALLPPGLAPSFTARDLAKALGGRVKLAQKMAYCLREAGVIVCVGKQGRANLYRDAVTR
jgi:hypothetical protein